MIHQELNLMPHLTIAQNIFIGREPRQRLKFVLDDKAINDQTRDLLVTLNLTLDPRTKVSDLTVAKQQMVEIAKALSFNAEVLIMDEPTAALTETEIDELFRIVRGAARSGRRHRPHQSPAGRTEANFRPDHGHARRALHRHRRDQRRHD